MAPRVVVAASGLRRPRVLRSCLGAAALCGAVIVLSCDSDVRRRPGPVVDPCAESTPIFQADTTEPSGFVECSDGVVHRTEARTCLDPLPGGKACSPESSGPCATDADCTELPHGRCINGEYAEASTCSCEYGCAGDADCADGRACVCSGVYTAGASCLPTDCLISDDCAAGLCRLAEQFASCGENRSRMLCTDDAECRTDDDCASLPMAQCWGEADRPQACVASSTEQGDLEWHCSAPYPCGLCG